MKLHDNIAQGSLEWRQLRAGKLTASEMNRIVSPKGKVRTGDGPETFLHEKLAEMWTGCPLPTAEFFQADNGIFLEEYARPAFTLETGIEVQEVGFIESDCGKLGCSPDGLAGEGCGLEIKCPLLQTHLGYLLRGVVPDDYILQVQSSMFITGFKKWKFFSFRRGMPPFILTVEPDENIQNAIYEAVQLFTGKLEFALEQLTQLNGGVRPEHPKPMRPVEEEKFVSFCPT